MAPKHPATFLLLSTLLFWSSQTPAHGQEKIGKPKIHVVHIAAQIQKQPLTVIERPGNVLFFTPYFTANATLIVDVPGDSDYTFGFIQQVDSKKQINQYERASTSWEMPQTPNLDLSSRGRDRWYDATNGSRTVKAGTKGLEFSLSMDDNLMSFVSWVEPLPQGFKKRAPGKLQAISRKESFTTWLVALRAADGKFTPIQKITWNVKADISVDTREFVGSRCRINAVENPQPKIVDASEDEIPQKTLGSKPANQVDQFWWIPQRGSRVQLNRTQRPLPAP